MTVDADYSSSFVRDPLNVSLTHSHIADALSRSPDHGTTLVLSKLNISNVSPGAAQALVSIGANGAENEHAIERLAVAHNRLLSLPAEFAQLTYLRYINLKHNQFTAFPHILTALASLEILDISHNKISSLPVQPGQLVNLKVLCLSRNKLTSIPSYIVQFNKLEVLQIDRNPLEWPPNGAINGSQGIESGQDMREWIQNLKKWIERTPKDLDEEPSYFDLGEETHWQYHTMKNGEAGDLSHTRSFSADSSLSFSSIPESISNVATSIPSSFEHQRPPPLHLGILRPYGEESSPTKSFNSYANSPDDSESFGEPSFTMSSPNCSFESLTQHNRNASYAGQEKHLHRMEVLGKMSMPDLRSAKLDFSKKAPAIPQPTRQNLPPNDASSLSNLERTPRHQASVSIARILGQLEDEYEDGSTSRALFSMTSERNSYFRRLSTSPALTSLPQSLLCLVDSARSLLFAACQVYQTLDHYTVHVVDERLSSVLRKVLEPASSDMLQLIASLDQFDTWSRRTLPPAVVCRAVVESCRDTAAAFSKVVRVLTLQLQVLTTCDDIRYSRLLLVELFTATAEIACAWKNMIPEIPHLKKLLHPNRLAGQVTTASQETRFVPTMDATVPLFRQQLNGSGSQSISASVSRARTIRRHAGSFSSKDVEIGKQLPSCDIASYGSGLSSSTQGRAQTPRTPRRQTTSPAALTSVQNGSHVPPNPNPAIRSISRGPEAIDRSHSRQDSRSSMQTSSVSSSPSIPNKAPPFLDIPSSSKFQVDREALQAVKNAVDIAPMVWDMIEAYLSDILPIRVDVRDGIKNARDVTKRLADMINALYECENLGDKKVLREDARLFLKAVVQLSNAIKNHKEIQDVPLSLRNNMVKLTNATEEFAILLHVSSFSPSTPRTFPPVISSVPIVHSSIQHSDDQLESSLSRSKSARSPLSVKVHAAEYRDGPRSALPTQSFKVPAIKRTRGRDI